VRLAILAPSGSVRMRLDGPIVAIAARIFSSMGRPTVTGATTMVDKISIARALDHGRQTADEPEACQDTGDVLAAELRADLQRQAPAGERIDHGQHPQLLPVR